LQNTVNRLVADTMSNAWPISFIELPARPRPSWDVPG